MVLVIPVALTLQIMKYPENEQRTGDESPGTVREIKKSQEKICLLC